VLSAWHRIRRPLSSEINFRFGRVVCIFGNHSILIVISYYIALAIICVLCNTVQSKKKKKQEREKGKRKTEAITSLLGSGRAVGKI
jgi:hypothetical protein